MIWKQKILDDSGKMLLLTARFDGREAFYYILLPSGRRHALLAAMDRRIALDLQEFGQVLHYGWGTPSEADKHFIREYYQAAL